MSYQVIQEVNGNHYLYDVESVWDRDAKKMKQSRRYLGKCDEEGNIISVNRRLPQISKTIGSYYSLLEIANDCGLYNDLVEVYGETDADQLISLAIIRAIRPGPMRQIIKEIDESFLPELLGYATPELSNLSMLLSSIGFSEQQTKLIFQRRMDKGACTLYDIEYLGNPNYRESFMYCAECRTARVPRKNLLIGYSEKDDLPCYMAVCRGSVTDMGTLRTVEKTIQKMKKRTTHYVLGPSFYNEMNLRDMLAMGPGFTIAVPTERYISAELLAEASAVFYSKHDLEDYNGYKLMVFEKKITIAGKEIRAIVLEEESRKYDEIIEVERKLADFEAYVRDMKWYPEFHDDVSRTVYNDALDLFEITESPDGYVRAERDFYKIRQLKHRCGKLIILTTSDAPWREVLLCCKRRETIEDDFDTLRNDIEARAKFVPTEDAAKGLFFVEFLSTILKDELLNRLRRHEEGLKMWTHDFIYEMSKLKVTKISGKWILNNISDEQKRLFEMAGIAPPLPEYN